MTVLHRLRALSLDADRRGRANALASAPVMAPKGMMAVCSPQCSREECMRSRIWPWLCLLLAPLVIAEPLRIGFGTHKPPYVFEGEDHGLEYDIVVAALRSAGYSPQAHYAPMERLHLQLRRGELDGIATTSPNSGIQAHYSDTYMHYSNVALALSSRGYRITRIADLGQYSVSAFQRA